MDTIHGMLLIDSSSQPQLRALWHRQPQQVLFVVERLAGRLLPWS